MHQQILTGLFSAVSKPIVCTRSSKEIFKKRFLEFIKIFRYVQKLKFVKIREILREKVCMHGPFRHLHPTGSIPSISSAQEAEGRASPSRASRKKRSKAAAVHPSPTNGFEPVTSRNRNDPQMGLASFNLLFQI